MSLSRAIGTALRDGISRAGLGEAEFARQIGISPKRLGAVLDGSVTPRVDTLDDWAARLGFTWQVTAAGDASRKALVTLMNHGVGRTGHKHKGLCPGDTDGYKTRDPKCRVCNALDLVKATWA